MTLTESAYALKRVPTALCKADVKLASMKGISNICDKESAAKKAACLKVVASKAVLADLICNACKKLKAKTCLI